MTFTLLVFAYRKPGLSPEEFRTHGEEIHIPLVKSIAGAQFPLNHVRRYIHRTEVTAENEGTASGGPSNPNNPATILVGAQEAVDYDGFSEMTFEDEKAFGAFMAKTREPSAAAKMAEDMEAFMDVKRTVMVRVGEILRTERD